MNLKRTRLTALGILVLVLLSAVVVWPKGPNINLKPLGINYQRELKIHEGLDLQGGSSLVYDADVSKIPDGDRNQALTGTVTVIENRINAIGVAEPTVQTSTTGGQYRVIVELPGVTDVARASSIIGRTVNLEVWEPIGLDEQPSTDPLLVQQQLANFKRTDLTGKDLQRATVGFNQQTGEPEISLQFKSDGTKKFADISKRNVGKIVPITTDAGTLEGGIVTAPRIQEEIPNGQAQISGSFDINSAKDLAKQLNSGALPVPVKLAEQRTVGPTLGQESVQNSLTAGLVGLVLVSAFMIFYYRWPGIMAVGALLIYTLLMIALFKLIPVTLTLAGIAGFILSIGIAVDANILIFERMKEELRAGRGLQASVEIGFSRAFSSIRDSNVASLLMAAVLYVFGSGTIRGFAVVLALGVLVSLFSAITVTRTFMRLSARSRIGNHLGWWGLTTKDGHDVA